MSETKRAMPRLGEPSADIFDRAHLTHYTMNIAELEAEVVGLFLSQLPITLKMLAESTSQSDWKLATHTLKGAAASVGAPRLQALAVEAEALTIDSPPAERARIVEALCAAAEEFRQAVRPLYP